jgi:ribonuclease Y
MDPLVIGLAAAVGLLFGAVGYVARGMIEQSRHRKAEAAAEDEASRILARAKEEADNLRTSKVLEGKEEVFRLRESWEQEEQRHREDAERAEQRLAERSEAQDRRFDTLNEKESVQEQRTKELDQRDGVLSGQAREVEQSRAQIRSELEALAGTSAVEAKQQLIDDLKDEAKAEAANDLREIKDEAQRSADRESKKILGLAIQRMAADQTAEMTVSVVQLPSDEMKGRIIGREGRNIRSFEAVTGVDLIVDDTPESVSVSTFDPVRREVARRTLQRLVDDGRIHPTSIEEAYEKAKDEVEQSIRDAGEWAMLEVGINRLHPELTTLIGRLKYRTSYGQNVLDHVVESAHIAGMLAAELDIDADEARRAAFLHDVGKAVSHEVGGSHALIGAEIARRFGEEPGVVHGIEAHHNEVEPRTLTAIIVQAADAVSAARPGARREALESYVRRLERLEEIARGFDGVEKVYALQAGREIRVVVDPGSLDDVGSKDLARHIARRLEEELQYPGQIEVTVIREFRAKDYAR